MRMYFLLDKSNKNIFTQIIIYSCFDQLKKVFYNHLNRIVKEIV